MQKKTSLVRDIIVVGFALFSMFFGAGNVIFPPYLGLESGSQWVSGFATYFIADIGLAMQARIVTVREVIAFLHNNSIDGKVYIDDEMKAKMEAYLEEYGAKG